MGYLTDKQNVQVYRSIASIVLSPTDDSVKLTITEGIDMPQPDGSVRFVPTQPDFTPDFGAQGPALINTPLSALLPVLGVADEAELGTKSLRQVIVALVDYALTPVPSEPK